MQQLSQALRGEHPLLAARGLLSGIGWTMALFIAGLAFGPNLLNSAKLGILASSGFAGTSGLIALTWLSSKNRRKWDGAPAPTGS